MISTHSVKLQLIEGLGLEDLDITDIDDNTALFNDGLGLDSVDAIELIVILDNAYGLKFKNMDETKDVFVSVQALTNYINAHEK